MMRRKIGKFNSAFNEHMSHDADGTLIGSWSFRNYVLKCLTVHAEEFCTPEDEIRHSKSIADPICFKIGESSDVSLIVAINFVEGDFLYVDSKLSVKSIDDLEYGSLHSHFRFNYKTQSGSMVNAIIIESICSFIDSQRRIVNRKKSLNRSKTFY